MSDFLNHSPKYVVSSTLKSLDWANSSLLTGDLAETLNKLKRQPGKDILIPGSPTLVRALAQQGLLDVLNLNVCPVVVGSGMRLFEGITKQIHLRFMSSITLSNGVVGLTYGPAEG